MSEVAAMAESVMTAVDDYIARSVAPFKDRVAALEKRLAELPVPKNGDPGLPGKDADPEAVAALVKEATAAILPSFVDHAVAKIRIPEDGEPGKDAVLPSLLINDAGELVAVHADGATKAIGMVRGKDGEDGVGKPGAPGRDATEIRILPALDESRSYPEGTCAFYRGGTVRAERMTDPITDGDLVKSGWRVALDGIAEESEQEFDDGRVIERTTIYTSGKVWSRRVQSKALLYRGVFRRGAKYEQGDVVTSGGSAWHAQKQTDAEPGTAPDDWKLCVRKGQDGKPGQSIKGDPGDPGKPGRDLTHMLPDGHKYS
jgi:hypothetical protein